jgi:hypothetical protein
MSQASFVVYIDESGDEGLNCAGNASSWFVLSAAITRKSRDLETVKVIDTVRELLKRPLKKPLHFRDLRHEHRLPFVLPRLLYKLPSLLRKQRPLPGKPPLLPVKPSLLGRKRWQLLQKSSSLGGKPPRQARSVRQPRR